MARNDPAPTFDFSEPSPKERLADRRKMQEPFGRIDGDANLHARLLPFCRLKAGEVWTDPAQGHRIGVIDAASKVQVNYAVDSASPTLCVADPPYNVTVGAKKTRALSEISLCEYDEFTDRWLTAVTRVMHNSASLYVWLGANLKNGMHPLPEFLLNMRKRKGWEARNWITVRNQRGYGTQKNWMWVRQELLYYTRNKPSFNVSAEYTDIPKILRGYYKDVGGERTENLERGKSQFIRAGNVWVDIQQVFYRLHENVPGCYAQKPLKAIERIVQSASEEGSAVIDPFAHSGTTLIACEKLNRRAITFDIDPVFAEISIRRLERFRQSGKEGWQCANPFPEVSGENFPQLFVR